MPMPVLWQLENAVCDAYEAKNCISSDLHGHRHFLITFISKGHGVQIINGISHDFKENDLFLLSPADFHKNTIAPGETFDYFGVKFTYEMLDEHLSGLCAIERFPMHIHLSNRDATIVHQIFVQLCDESNQGRERVASLQYQQALIEQLIILAIRQLPVSPPNQSGTFSDRALGYVYSHFFEPITVSDVATFVGYTPNYFNTRFRQTIGRPFGDFLRQLRLTYSENLLCSSTTSVSEIALEAGFGSLSHFSHCFRLKYGMSPQAYRKLKNNA